MISRRQFAGTIAAASIAGGLRAQEAAPAPEWGGPVIDVHLHLRRGLDADMVHMQGCGVTNANLLLTMIPLNRWARCRPNIPAASSGRPVRT
jgi:hypothetical protein